MFLGIAWVEWFGYAASLVVAVSLMMSSIVKLRWFNLAGAAMFTSYGFMIGALPVGFLNLFIVSINVVYLVRMYREQDDFRIMNLSGDGEYLDYFLDCHRKEIGKFFPHFNASQNEGRDSFYLVKNSVPIGLLIGRRQDDNSFLIELDFVVAQFRDFKMGSFIYQRKSNDFFSRHGFKRLIAPATRGDHDAYLRRMGFAQEGEYFVKAL